MLNESDKIAFASIVREFAADGHSRFGIGTYKEKTLHYVLKKFFEQDISYHEVKCCGFVADVMKDGNITEIQTASLSGMRDKLAAYAESSQVKSFRIVFPIAACRRIFWIDPANGEISGGRKARSATKYSFLSELIYISEFLKCGKLILTIAEVALDEYRCLNGWSRDRKKGAEKLDRVPVDILSVTDYAGPIDLSDFVPESLPDRFTRNDFSKAASLKGRRLWAALKVLEENGVIAKTESEGRAHIYEKIL